MTLRLGTRRSALATAQATWVADRLRELGHDVELTPITTLGDTSSRPLAEIGGTGVFATGIRLALQRDEIDVAVHSLKDLPVAPEPGLRIAAVPVREDPRDVLVARDGRTLGELPSGAVVGTGSPRRAAQLAALGLGLQVRSIRGNVGTRLRLVGDGSCDAIVLARAGLARLGRLDVVTEVLDPLQMLSAPGQGALAVEVRADDSTMVAVVAALDHADTRACVDAERALLAALEAGCTAPVGALAEVAEGESGDVELWIRAFVGTEDASFSLRRSLTGAAGRPEQLGRDLAALLLEDGAGRVTATSDPTPSGSPAPPGEPSGSPTPPGEPARAGDPDRSSAAPDPDTAYSAPPSRPEQTAPERAQ